MKASDRFLFALITVGCLSLAVCWQLTVKAQGPHGTSLATLILHSSSAGNAPPVSTNTSAAPAASSLPIDNKIVFFSDRDGNNGIYLMNTDGSSPTKISNNSASDLYPTWSPDGTKIAFFSTRDGNQEIYTMNADGSNQTRLTTDPATDQYPVWSPDGTKIAFSSGRSGNDEIWVMNADGSNPTRVTTTRPDFNFSFEPAWSPDGSKIAFVRQTQSAQNQIWVMNADGSNPHVVISTISSVQSDDPAWSPDGTKLAFSRYTRGVNPSNSDIYVQNSDGSGSATRLTTNAQANEAASWSPDGTKLLFVSERNGNQEIYVMNSDGSNQTRLTNNTAQDFWPHWQPLQQCIAPPSGLFAWFPGDGNANDIQGNNNGTLLNGATFDIGKVGQSYKFDGVDDVVSTTAYLPYTNGVTFDAWVKTTDADGTIMDDGGGNLTSRGMGLFIQAGALRLFGSKDSSSAYNFTLTGPTVNDGIFHHVAATWTNTTAANGAKLYLDGVLVAQTTAAQSIGSSSQNINLGGHTAFSYNKLTGLIDEAQVFTRVLSQTEIQNIYNAGSAGTCKPATVCTPPLSNLVAWLPGDGNSNDIQGSYNGTPQGGVSYAVGKVGQAFNLNGTSGALRINSYNFAASDFTVATWVKFTETGRTRTLYASDYDAGPSIAELAINSNNTASFEIRDTGYHIADAEGTTALNDGAWHYLVGERNGTTAKLYVDGILQSSQTNGSLGTLTAACGFGWIGGRNVDTPCATTANNFLFGGLIDEFQIYSRALSLTDIQNIYNAGTSGTCKGNVVCTPSPSGMVSWFAGENNANDIQGSNNGTLQGGVTFAAGEVRQAFNLDGIDDYVTVSNNAPFDFGTNDFSVDTWANFRSLTGLHTLFAHMNTSVGNGYLLEMNDSALRFFVRQSASVDNDLTIPVSLQAGVWYHITAVRQGVTSYLYLDGVLIGQQSAAQTINTGASDTTYLGRFYLSASRFFNGQLDELHVFNRALTASEVQTIYGTGNAGLCKRNDNFANAQGISGSSGSITGSNVGATKEVGEPNPTGTIGGASIWYRWQAPASGTTIFTTAGSSIDTLLGVYTGSSVNSLTEIASNDDKQFSSLNTSQVIFNAAAGTTYYLLVDGVRGQTGDVVLSWSMGSEISGKVTGSGGAGRSGVVVSLSGGASRTATTDANGFYSFANLPTGANYTVAAGTDYKPANLNYTTLTDFITDANFIPSTTGQSITIAGHIRDSAGHGYPDIFVHARCVPSSGGAGTSVFTATDSSGTYILGNNLSGGDCTITFDNQTSYSIFDITPSQLGPFSHLTSDILNADFTVTNVHPLYTLGGLVSNGAGGALSGVTITLSGGNLTQPLTMQTDTLGNYAFASLLSGNYMVTAQKSGVTFTQSTLTINNLSGNMKSADFTAAAAAPAPAVSSLAPPSAQAGSAAFTLTVNGSNFVNGAVVTFNGNNRTTTFVNSAQLSAQITAADVQTSGAYPVTVVNPSGGGTSNPMDFTVTAPAALRIDTVVPAAGRSSGGQQLTLTGSFTNLSAVKVDGVTATIVSSNSSQVIITTPAHGVGAVQIDLVPATGATYSKANAFAYLPTVFTDNTLMAGVTTAKAQHIIELRQAVDALRAVAGLAAAQWTDATLTPTSSLIKAVDITELRARLEEAAVALGYAQMNYTDPTLNSSLPIRRMHIEELRQRIRSIAG